MATLIEYSLTGERKHRIEYALVETGTPQGDRDVALWLSLYMSADETPEACVWLDGTIIRPTDEDKKAYEDKIETILRRELLVREEKQRRERVVQERAERETRREGSRKGQTDGSGNVGTDVGVDKEHVCESVDGDARGGESDV